MLGLSVGLNAGLNTRRAQFSPLDLPNLVGWWDASDTSTITESGGLVSQWDDKSGNANHAVQAVGASQLSTGVETLNGLNVLSSTARGKFMDVTTISESQPSSYVAVFTADIAGGVADGIGSSTRNYHGYSATSVVGFAQTMFAGSQVSTFATDVPFGTYTVWGAVFNGASSFGYRDGVLGSTVNPGAQGVTAGLRLMGHATNSASFGIAGKLAEFVMYSRALSVDELATLTSYLNGKWQVYS